MADRLRAYQGDRGRGEEDRDAREEGRGLTSEPAPRGADQHAYRCVLAHYLADVQEVLDDEVSWDRTALHEYACLSDDDLAPVGIPDTAGLAPSLHLNLGDGYLRQGRVGAAAEQLGHGLAAVGALSDDGYGRMIREGLARLEGRIDAADAPAGR